MDPSPPTLAPQPLFGLCHSSELLHFYDPQFSHPFLRPQSSASLHFSNSMAIAWLPPVAPAPIWHLSSSGQLSAQLTVISLVWFCLPTCQCSNPSHWSFLSLTHDQAFVVWGTRFSACNRFFNATCTPAASPWLFLSPLVHRGTANLCHSAHILFSSLRLQHSQKATSNAHIKTYSILQSSHFFPTISRNLVTLVEGHISSESWISWPSGGLVLSVGYMHFPSPLSHS